MQRLISALIFATLALSATAPSQAAAPDVKMYRLDCGHMTLGDKSVFSDAGLYKGLSQDIVMSCYLIKHGEDWVLALAGYGLFRWRVQLATARVAERMQERLDERTRIARTLHDSFLQSVQALIMRFDRIKRGLAINDPLQREIDNALDTADAVLLEGREQVWALRSGDDAQPGLHRALEEAAAACGQQYGVTVHVEQQGKPVPLSDSVQHEVHAIALEALHNACRHSGAATVHVTLRYAPDSMQLRVLDAGCGIDDQVLANGAPHGHWGLAGMRERAHLVKASLRISRRAGGGTEVRLDVPLAS